MSNNITRYFLNIHNKGNESQQRYVTEPNFLIKSEGNENTYELF